jgi:hypothetical protein
MKIDESNVNDAWRFLVKQVWGETVLLGQGRTVLTIATRLPFSWPVLKAEASSTMKEESRTREPSLSEPTNRARFVDSEHTAASCQPGCHFGKHPMTSGASV